MLSSFYFTMSRCSIRSQILFNCFKSVAQMLGHNWSLPMFDKTSWQLGHCVIFKASLSAGISEQKVALPAPPYTKNERAQISFFVKPTQRLKVELKTSGQSRQEDHTKCKFRTIPFPLVCPNNKSKVWQNTCSL